jgi:hypothetical protein
LRRPTSLKEHPVSQTTTCTNSCCSDTVNLLLNSSLECRIYCRNFSSHPIANRSSQLICTSKHNRTTSSKATPIACISYTDYLNLPNRLLLSIDIESTSTRRSWNIRSPSRAITMRAITPPSVYLPRMFSNHSSRTLTTSDSKRNYLSLSSGSSSLMS